MYDLNNCFDATQPLITHIAGSLTTLGVDLTLLTDFTSYCHVIGSSACMSSIGQPPPGSDPHARGCVHGSTLRPLRAASSGSSVVQMHRHRHPGASRLQTAAAAVGYLRALLHLRAASGVISGSIIPGQLAGVASAGCTRSGGRPLHCRASRVCIGMRTPGGSRDHGRRRAPDALVIWSRHLRRPHHACSAVHAHAKSAAHRPSRFHSSVCTCVGCSTAGCGTLDDLRAAISDQKTPENPEP